MKPIVTKFIAAMRRFPFIEVSHIASNLGFLMKVCNNMVWSTELENIKNSNLHNQNNNSEHSEAQIWN